MSEFQTSLLVIGALVVCGVIAYNKWQEHRARHDAEEVFRSEFPDALIAGAVESASSAPGKELIADAPASPAPRLQPEPRVLASHSAEPAAKPAIDYSIDLQSDHPLAAAALRDAWGGMELRFGPRVVLNAFLDGDWAPLPAGGNCSQVRAAFQLVSREGVVSEAELIEFRSEVETLAAKFGVAAQAPEMREALEGARRIDQVCADADVQIAFHVVASHGEVFAGTKLRAAAEASGLVIDAEGRFSLLDDRGRQLFNLADRSGDRFSSGIMKDAAPQALTLSMDVPRAPDTQRTFDSMVRFARTLASLLGGTLVDDNNQPIDERSLSAIGAQLSVVRATLEAVGVVPGSTLALRLFS